MTTESATFREPFEEIEPVRLKLGTYRELTYDAKLELDGLTWYRVQGGFGDTGGKREDWVLALPDHAPSTSVSRHLNRRTWGSHFTEYATQCENMREAVKRSVQQLDFKIEEETEKLSNLFRARTILTNREVQHDD